MSKFSRVAVEPGVFKVLTIAHQRNMCQTQLDNLTMRVHQIPSARVSHGRSVQDHIREGDQVRCPAKLVNNVLMFISGHYLFRAHRDTTVHFHLPADRAHDA